MRPIEAVAGLTALAALGCASVHEAREPRPALACIENRVEYHYVVLQDGEDDASCTRVDFVSRSGGGVSLLPEVVSEGPLVLGTAYWVPYPCVEIDPTNFTARGFVGADGGSGTAVSTETGVAVLDVQLHFPDGPPGFPGPGEVEIYAVDLEFDERCPVR